MRNRRQPSLQSLVLGAALLLSRSAHASYALDPLGFVVILVLPFLITLLGLISLVGNLVALVANRRWERDWAIFSIASGVLCLLLVVPSLAIFGFEDWQPLLAALLWGAGGGFSLFCGLRDRRRPRPSSRSARLPRPPLPRK
jgi:hypothetical protein